MNGPTLTVASKRAPTQCIHLPSLKSQHRQEHHVPAYATLRAWGRLGWSQEKAMAGLGFPNYPKAGVDGLW